MANEKDVGHPKTTEGSGKFQQPVLRGDNALHIDSEDEASDGKDRPAAQREFAWYQCPDVGFKRDTTTRAAVGRNMKLGRRALDDPDRKVELEAALDDRVSELIAEANDAGYSTDEAMEALQAVVKNQAVIAGNDRDQADDPDAKSDSVLF